MLRRLTPSTHLSAKINETPSRPLVMREFLISAGCVDYMKDK